ncbi:MAG: D-glycero-beta-D-manno-heptose 1,7-bisphosphate 7-phosphatase [Pseudomonadota bacterium]
MGSRLVILDRDGVINHDSDHYVRSAGQWLPIDGSIEAIAAMSKAGFVVTVATNQSGIGRGLYTRDALYQMNRKLRRLVGRIGGRVATIAFCPHTPGDDCACRKPRPGLLHDISRRTGIALAGATLVGDSARDLEAGATTGCKLWLVRTGNGEETIRTLERQRPAWWDSVTVANDLAAVADRVIERGWH